jgi:hypothetical protein
MVVMQRKKMRPDNKSDNKVHEKHKDLEIRQKKDKKKCGAQIST